MSERRRLAFTDGWQKAQWLDGAARLDSLHPTIRGYGRTIRETWPDDARWRANAAHLIACDLRYRSDRDGQEEFADAPEVLRTGEDDCDGLARLVVALCLAAGMHARIRPVFARPADFTHVQAEILIDRVWTVSDPSVAAPLGQGAEGARRRTL